ncbi:MAG: retroviral-like aspartic protease family protein, partial [Planctomycetaceae bacterium]
MSSVSPKDDLMGKVVETIKLTNFSQPDKSQEVEAIIDTGATMLVLPAEVIQSLGLQKDRDVNVRYANHATQRKSIYGVVTVELQGRSGHFDVLEEAAGTAPLVGQIILEQLD